MHSTKYASSLLAALLIGLALLMPAVPAFASSNSPAGISAPGQFADPPVTPADTTTEPPAPPPPPPAPEKITTTTEPPVIVTPPIVIPPPVVTVPEPVVVPPPPVTVPNIVTAPPPVVTEPVVTAPVISTPIPLDVTHPVVTAPAPLIVNPAVPDVKAPSLPAMHRWPSDNGTPPHSFPPPPGGHFPPPPGGNPPHRPFPPRNPTYPWWYTNGWPPYNNNDYWVGPGYYPQDYQQVPQTVYPPVVSTFTANPNYVQPGQSATLFWTVNNADTVTISPDVGSVASSGSVAVVPAYTTTYTLTAYSNYGSVSASTTVTVAPPYVSSYSTYGAGGSASAVAGSGPYYPNSSAGATTGYGSVYTGNSADGIAGQGSYYPSSPSASSSGTISTGGISSGAPAAMNLWLMYVLLIGLLAVAVAVIIFLLVRRPSLAHARSQAGTSAGYVASATAPAATLPATMTPVTTPVEAGLPAKFVSPGGTTMPVTGKPLGRRDFQALMPSEKADLISRRHILVTYENSKYQIEDLDSTNGTKLNGSEIRGGGKHTIENGDTVELAGVLDLTF
jgi:hypothetical protein